MHIGLPVTKRFWAYAGSYDRKIVVLLAALFYGASLQTSAFAQAAATDAATPAVYATEAKQVLLIEAETGSVLFERTAISPLPRLLSPR